MKPPGHLFAGTGKDGGEQLPSPHPLGAQAACPPGGSGGVGSSSRSGLLSGKEQPAVLGLSSRQRVDGERERTGEDSAEKGREGQSAHALALTLPQRSPTVSFPPPAGGSSDPSSSPASPQRMGHGEAPLQADALVHQELPEEPGGAARGVPGRARPRCRGRRGGALHRCDGVEAGQSARRGIFPGQPRGRGRGRRGAAGGAPAPPYPGTFPRKLPPGQMGKLRHGAGCRSLLPLFGGRGSLQTRLTIAQFSGLTWLKRMRCRNQKGKHPPL